MLWLASCMILTEELNKRSITVGIEKGVHFPLHSRIEQHQDRVESLDFESIYQLVEEWLLQRPLMLDHDKQKGVFKLILAEIDEFITDLIKNYTTRIDESGKDDYLRQRLERVHLLAKNFSGQTEEEHQFKQWLQLYTEALDQVFFIMGHAVGNQIQLNYDSIYSRINGQGNQSAIFDNLRLLASGILDVNPTIAMQEYLTTCGSMIAHLEMFVDPKYVIRKIIDKNDKNHPVDVYQFNQVVFDPNLGEEVIIALLPEERDEAFADRIRKMRLIRRAVELAKPDSAEHIQASLVTEHLDLIINHRDRSKFRILAMSLVDSLGQHGKLFTYDLLVAVESEPHRVIPGLKSTELQITSQSRGEIVIAH